MLARLEGEDARGDGRGLSPDVETRGMERVVLVILSIAVVGLGLAPWFAMDLMRPAIALIVGGHP